MHVPLSQTLVLFGSNGLIGKALLDQFTKRGTTVITITMNEITTHGIESVLSRRLEPFAQLQNLDVIYANGLTDPTLSPEFLEAANVDFPKTVDRLLRYQNRAYSKNFRTLTLGSVHELIQIMVESNPYIRSKKHLADWMFQQSRTFPGQYLHLRLHTLYGPKIGPHLFLGQMISALKEKTLFEMSSGEQLREYHHVDDISKTVFELFKLQWQNYAMLISTGDAIALRDLAQYIFEQLGQTQNLKLGAKNLTGPDNLEHRFPPSEKTLVGHYRKPLDGILTVVKEALL